MLPFHLFTDFICVAHSFVPSTFRVESQLLTTIMVFRDAKISHFFTGIGLPFVKRELEMSEVSQLLIRVKVFRNGRFAHPCTGISLP